MAARRPSSYFADLAAAAYTALAALGDGSSSSETVAGVSYGSANIPTLEAVAELYDVKGAIQAITQGGQAFAHGDGRALTRGDLPTLLRRRDQLEQRAARATRGGIPVTLAVPLG